MKGNVGRSLCASGGGFLRADEAAEVYDDSHFAPPDLAEADVLQAVEQLCNRLYENGYFSVPTLLDL